MTKIIQKNILRFFSFFLILSLLPIAVSNYFPEKEGYNLLVAEEKKKKRKRAKLPSKKAQKIMQQVQPLLEAESWDEAEMLISQIGMGEKFSGTDRGVMYFYLGYIYFSTEEYDQAMDAYIALINEEEADYRQQNQARYSLAQLSYINEDYRAAEKYLLAWIENEEMPSSQAYSLLATTYYQLQEFRNAKSNIEIAISMAEEKEIPILDENGEETGEVKSGIGRENDYLLKMAIFNELKENLDVLPIYEILVQHYPKKQYWVQLSGLYGSRERQMDQMAALEAAYEDELLDKQREFVALSQLLFLHQNPHKAALVMSDGFSQGVIKEEEKTLKALAQYWHASKELKKAKPYYKKAAKVSEKGEIFIFLGQVHFGLDEYKDAEEAIRSGIKKGKLKDEAGAYMLLGQVQFERQKWDEAITTFRKTIDVAETQYSDKKKKEKAKKKKLQDQARKWITYTEGEEERVIALEMKRKDLGV